MVQDVGRHVKLNIELPRRKIQQEEGKLDLNLRQHSFVWCWNLDTAERRSAVPGKFWNVLLEKDKPDRSWVEWRTNILHTVKRRKADWTGHILRRNCGPKHVVGGRIEGKIEVRVRWGRRCKQLLDDLKDTIRYWKLQEPAPDRTVWATGLGRRCGLAYRNSHCVVTILDNLFLITKHFSRNFNSLGRDKEV
jgi:hypothetical protein